MTERTCAAADLPRALKGCSTGDTLTVDGDVTRAKLSGLAFDGAGVVIRGRFVGYNAFDACPGITLTGEIVETAGTMALGVANSARFRLENMIVRGTFVDADGYCQGAGAIFTNCGPGCEVVGSEFHHLGSAIGVKQGDGLLVEGCRFHDIKADAIDLYNGRGVTIRRNRFADFFPAPSDHPDCVQLDVRSGWQSPERIVIEDNLYEIGKGKPVQGLQIKATADLPLKGFAARRNAFFGGMFNAVNVEHGIEPVVTDNFAQGLETNLFNGKPMGCFIVLRSPTGATVTGNAANNDLGGDNRALPLAKDAADRAELDAFLARVAPAPVPVPVEPAPAPAEGPTAAQIADLTSQVAGLNAQLADLTAQLSAAKADAETTRQALAAMTAERDALAGKIAAAQADLA